MRKRKREPSSDRDGTLLAAAFNIDGFCKRYGIKHDLAYGEIRKGRLKARKVGRRTIIASADAAQWLKGLPPLKLEA